MLQIDEPDDFVIATGAAHPLEEFVALVEGGLDWRSHVDLDASLRRPSDILCSLGDPSKAAEVLDWRASVCFAEIVLGWSRRKRANSTCRSQPPW